MSSEIQNLSFKFYSITKFVQTINELAKTNKLPFKLNNYDRIDAAYIWFKGDETFNGKFDDYCIRQPAYMKLLTSHNRNYFIKHEQILSLFESRPIICFKQTMWRTVPKGNERKNMYYIVISFNIQQTAAGFPYFPVELIRESNKTIINTVEKQIISFEDNQNNESFVGNEKEIDKDAL